MYAVGDHNKNNASAYEPPSCSEQHALGAACYSLTELEFVIQLFFVQSQDLTELECAIASF